MNLLGGVFNRAPLSHDHRISHIGSVAWSLGVDPDNLQQIKSAFTQSLQPGTLLSRDGDGSDVIPTFRLQIGIVRY